MRTDNHVKEQWAKLVYHEIRQAKEEGKDTSRLFGTQSECSEHAWNEQDYLIQFSVDELIYLYHRILELPMVAFYQYEEPELWEDLKKSCPGFSSSKESNVSPWDGNDESLFEKLYGGLLGRSSGCSLGNPFPSGLTGPNGESGYELLKGYLIAANAWPLINYLPGKSPYTHLELRSPESWLENISFVEPDDDLRYTVLSLVALESFGSSIETHHVAKIWLDYLSYNAVSTAERQAYLNMVTLSKQSKTYVVREEDIQFVSTYNNPYREWIGAQIRADGWAYACPGDPAEAARLAWMDARLSHRKNGIYGSMYMAALIAAAFVTKDIQEAITIALRFIPSKSRIHSAISLAMELAEQYSDQETLIIALHRAFGSYHPIHAINNAAVVTASLLHGGNDFGKCIATAVLVGWDSDCNGASVGSVWGVLHGAEAIPTHWKQPLNDTLYTGICGFDPISIKECAKRFLVVAKSRRD